MRYYEGGRNGGTLPEEIRHVFHDAVDAYLWWEFRRFPPIEPTVYFDIEDREITLSRACGLVWNCANYLPLKLHLRVESCFWLEEPIGFTYACAARRLRPLIEWRLRMAAQTKNPGQSEQITSVSKADDQPPEYATADEAMRAIIELFNEPKPKKSNSTGD